MKFKEIIKILDDARVSHYDFADERITKWNGVGDAPVVARKGGSIEDGGDGSEDFFIVRHFVDHDVYIRLEGTYDNISGYDYFDEILTEVEPKQVTITVYNERVILTFEQLKAKMNSMGVTPKEFAKNSINGLLALEKEVGEIREIERVGENEEDGCIWYVVKYFVKHDVYARVDAFYDIDSRKVDFTNSVIYQVRPIIRPIIFYEP